MYGARDRAWGKHRWNIVDKPLQLPLGPSSFNLV